MSKPPRRRVRRTSVSAECIDASTTMAPTVTVPKTEDETKRIRIAVEKNFLFQGIGEEQNEMVFGAMDEKKFSPGEEIITQGDTGDFFYVLDDGEADVLVDGVKVHHYSKGASFGELALMYNCPRAATVVAVDECTVWALDRNAFRHISSANQDKKRKTYEVFLRKCPLFESISDSDISRIADVLEEITYKPGEVVIKEGDADFDQMKFYIVYRGQAQAFRDTEDGNSTMVGNMTEGNFFGEKALIEKQPRAASVIAQTNLEVAALDTAAFERLLGPCKDLMLMQIQSYNEGETPRLAIPAVGSAVNAIRCLTPKPSSEANEAAVIDEAFHQDDQPEIVPAPTLSEEVDVASS